MAEPILPDDNHKDRYGNRKWESMSGYSKLPPRPSRPSTTCFVYKITNNITGSAYIGVSLSPRHRLCIHIRDNYPVGRALRKYGLSEFTIELLFSGAEKYCYEIEPIFIASYGTLAAAGGYNIDPGGCRPPRYTGIDHPNFGKPLSSERKLQLRLANLGKRQSQETRNKRNIYAKPSEETRAKLRVARAKQEQTPQSRLRKSIALRGNCAKVDIETVRLVRASALSNSELSRLYFVSRRTIADIRNRQTWRWVE
jgi:group I intron endonuclease